MIVILLATALLSISNLASAEVLIPEYQISCSETQCTGFYKGPEFIGGDDVAHQLSNKISEAVGDKLKELYKSGAYTKVDFSTIKMITEGMGSGTVEYTVVIPLISVYARCEAYTSFDHVGGWNHSPALKSRKKQLSKVLLSGEKLAISNLKSTPEGLQEYWFQWKNKVTQLECAQK